MLYAELGSKERQETKHDNNKINQNLFGPMYVNLKLKLGIMF